MIRYITDYIEQYSNVGHQFQYTVFLTEKCCKYNRIKVTFTDYIMQSADLAMDMMNKTITKITK